jgi:hypothetical protein
MKGGKINMGRKKNTENIFTEEANEQACETETGEFRRLTSGNGTKNFDSDVSNELEETWEYF